jgi:hypothetical protein
MNPRRAWRHFRLLRSPFLTSLDAILSVRATESLSGFCRKAQPRDRRSKFAREGSDSPGARSRARSDSPVR